MARINLPNFDPATTSKELIQNFYFEEKKIYIQLVKIDDMYLIRQHSVVSLLMKDHCHRSVSKILSVPEISQYVGRGSRSLWLNLEDVLNSPAIRKEENVLQFLIFCRETYSADVQSTNKESDKLSEEKKSSSESTIEGLSLSEQESLLIRVNKSEPKSQSNSGIQLAIPLSEKLINSVNAIRVVYASGMPLEEFIAGLVNAGLLAVTSTLNQEREAFQVIRGQTINNLDQILTGNSAFYKN